NRLVKFRTLISISHTFAVPLGRFRTTAAFLSYSRSHSKQTCECCRASIDSGSRARSLFARSNFAATGESRVKGSTDALHRAHSGRDCRTGPNQSAAAANATGAHSAVLRAGAAVVHPTVPARPRNHL